MKFKKRETMDHLNQHDLHIFLFTLHWKSISFFFIVVIKIILRKYAKILTE